MVMCAGVPGKSGFQPNKHLRFCSSRLFRAISIRVRSSIKPPFVSLTRVAARVRHFSRLRHFYFSVFGPLVVGVSAEALHGYTVGADYSRCGITFEFGAAD